MTPDTIPPGFLRFPGRTILRVSGTDRLRFLNGQVTNDMRLVQGDTTLPTAVLDGKGRLEAFCHVRNHGECYLIDAHPSLRESLPARLDRYLIADDAEIADRSDAWHMIHVLGSASPTTPDTFAYPVNRFGVPGTDLLSVSTIQPDLPELTAETVEDVRIRHGIPAWPHELHPGIFAAEAGLDTTAVSFDKGCYLGQEIVSRMKHAGKTNQHLVQLTVPESTVAGTALRHLDTEAGAITSVSPLPGPDGTRHALAYRKRRFEDVAMLESDAGTASVIRRLS